MVAYWRMRLGPRRRGWRARRRAAGRPERERGGMGEWTLGHLRLRGAWVRARHRALSSCGGWARGASGGGRLLGGPLASNLSGAKLRSAHMETHRTNERRGACEQEGEDGEPKRGPDADGGGGWARSPCAPEGARRRRFGGPGATSEMAPHLGQGPVAVCPPRHEPGRRVSRISTALLTPNDLFFVRNHAPTPVIDPATYALTVGGPGAESEVRLTLDDLQALPTPDADRLHRVRGELAGVLPVGHGAHGFRQSVGHGGDRVRGVDRAESGRCARARGGARRCGRRERDRPRRRCVGASPCRSRRPSTRPRFWRSP